MTSFQKVADRVWGPPKPPIQWVTGTCSLAVKWPEREADYSPLLNAKVICYLACHDTISCLHSYLNAIHTQTYIYMKHYIYVYTNKQTKNSHALHLPLSKMHHYRRLTFSTKTISFRIDKPQHITFSLVAQQPPVDLSLRNVALSRSHSVTHATFTRTPLDE